MSKKYLGNIDEAADSYFNDTPLSEWSYLGFLEALKPVWMSSARDVTIAENSSLRKRFCNILKRILSEEQENEKGGVATLLLQSVRNLLCLSFLNQELHSLEGVPFLLQEGTSQEDLSNSVTETLITFGKLKFPTYYDKLKTIQNTSNVEANYYVIAMGDKDTLNQIVEEEGCDDLVYDDQTEDMEGDNNINKYTTNFRNIEEFEKVIAKIEEKMHRLASLATLIQ
ncbi:11405_t:CDS:2 [Entrophospora sp. SA101]|nr:11405_t:CDS:2 [Entrophospora sp. SA101]